MRVFTYVSEERFDPQAYDEDIIKREGVLYEAQIDSGTPTWAKYRIQTHHLEDESGYIQLGQVREHTYYKTTWEDLSVGPSSWTQYPDRYKFLSLEFTFGKDYVQTRRSAYSLLDWLGDVGGLTDALFLLVELVVAPFASF